MANMHPSKATTFRQKAEEQLNVRTSKISSQLSVVDILKLNHELQVQQIELEMQNGELIQTNEELKLAELALKESEEKYRVSEMELKSAQSVAHLGNWKWNLKTNEVIWSDEMFHIFGIDKYSDSGPLGDAIRKVMHPDDLYLVLPSNASEFAEKKPIEYRIIMPDKTIRYILAIAGEAILDSIGNPLFLTGISQDITELKQVEFKIQQQNLKLAKLNEDKDLFIAVLGHDLRSPFSGLLGLSNLLNENIEDFDIEQIKNLAGHINKSAQSTFNLLEDILMWAKTQQGKIPYMPQNLSFTGLCNNILETIIPTAIEKNITINYSITDKLSVFADEEMLKTVLRNLISNAIKFTNNGGAININAVQTPSVITISISDNGVGMSTNSLEKLFIISEVHSTTGTANEKGTGLGLLLCKEFVDKLGGRIWVESTEGTGSTFSFSIPTIK
jgi:signal transduction histidine kinase